MLTEDLERTVLDNGLTILTREVHTAPIISAWIWFRVGSRNEVPGRTGLSHWVEHMLFKGTPTFPQGDYDRLVEREGGTFNGMTWIDWTTYYETLPSDRVDLALRIESDRMVNARFDPEETERERTVIIAEREGRENRPTYLLHEQVQALSFHAHPYRHMVIGSKEDLRAITRDELYEHYKTYYAPNNAVIVAVGDFETADMLAKIQGYYGDIPSHQDPPPVRVQDPPPRGERRTHIQGSGGATHLLIAHGIPGADHADFFPLVVLDAILDGARGLPPYASISLGRSARLYRALVNTQLAVSAGTSLAATIDPYLHAISATVHPEQTAARVESAILDEIARLQEEPVSADELERTRKGTRIQFAYGSESITHQAMWLGRAEMAVSTAWLGDYMQRLAEVTAADVQRVAQTYFQPRNRVIGLYQPNGKTNR